MKQKINIIEVRTEGRGAILAYGDGRANVSVQISRGAVYSKNEAGERNWNDHEHRYFLQPTPSSLCRVFWAQMKLLAGK